MDQSSVSMREYVDISNTDAQNSIDQTVGGVFNADILESSTSKPPTLDDYPDLTMTQIVELDLILNANTTPDVKPRNRNPDKYDTSPYIRLSKGDSSVRRGPIFCRIKHPFESHNGFEVATELIDEFNKWVFKGVSSKPDRPWKDGLPNYVDKSQSNPLEVKHMTHLPEQEEISNNGVLICVLLISIQSTIVEGMPQSFGIMKKQRMMIAQSVRVK
ncbi:hypothetical protein KY284_030259 [Solanum tuberosum]|nr:hypothetical protein KY284_030259 [Solanum tuberosum]